MTTDTVGGVWDYTCTLAHALDEAGHDVLLAVFGEIGDRHRRLPSGVEVATRPYRLEWMPDSDPDVEASTAWVADLAGLWEADLVHLNQFSPALGQFEVPVLLVAHSDVLSWFSESLGAPAPDEWKRYAGRVRRALQRATAVVVPTEYQSALLARHYGRPADRVIHNGVVPPASVPERREPFALCAARAWDSAKGAETLDRAAGLLEDGTLPVHLLGPCSSPDGEGLKPRHLIAHGPVERAEVDRFMQRAAIYVAPSLYEPFGLAPLEAALHGCALVLSDIGSFREVWDGSAIFFPPGDAEALAALLSDLAADPRRVERRAAGARRRAMRRLTADRMSSAYISLYAELAGPPHRTFSRPLEQPV